MLRIHWKKFEISETITKVAEICLLRILGKKFEISEMITKGY